MFLIRGPQLLTTPLPSLFHELMMLDAPIKINFNFQLSTSLTGLSSLVPPFGTRIPHQLVIAKYREAITALSYRLGQDKWFLGSRWVSHTVGTLWGSK